MKKIELDNVSISIKDEGSDHGADEHADRNYDSVLAPLEPTNVQAQGIELGEQALVPPKDQDALDKKEGQPFERAAESGRTSPSRVDSQPADKLAAQKQKHAAPAMGTPRGDGDVKIKLPIPVDNIEIQDAIDAAEYRKDTRRNEQSIIAIEEKVTYLELMAFIQSTHPTLEVPCDNRGNSDLEEPQLPFKQFDLADELGNLAPKLPWVKKGEDEEDGGTIEITDMSQQLGLGPTLFLMSTKAFAYFFLVLAIFNIPVLVFFGTGNAVGEMQKFTDLFALLSMGNVGQSGYACNSVKVSELYEKDYSLLGYNADEQMEQYQQASQINLNCGIGSKISQLMYMGLNHNKTSNCKHIIDDPASYEGSFKDDCFYKNSGNSTENKLFDYQDSFTTRQTLLGFEQDYSVFDTIEDKRMNKAEQKCLENVTATSDLDFSIHWFNCHCIGESSCSLPALTSSSYTYGWDRKTSKSKDVKPNKFVLFPRQNWLGYKIKDQCYKTLQEEASDKKEKPRIIALASCIMPTIHNPFTGEAFAKDQLGVMIVFFDIFSVIALIVFAKVLISTQEDYVKAFDKATIQMKDFTIRIRNLPHHLMYEDKDDVLRAILMQHFQQILKDEIELKKEQARLVEKDMEFDGLSEIAPMKSANTLEALDYEIADINFGKGNMTEMELLMKMSELQGQQTRNMIRLSMIKKDNQPCCGDSDKVKIEKAELKLNYQFEKLRDSYLEELKKQQDEAAEVEGEERNFDSDPDVRYAYITFRSMDAVDLVRDSYKRYGPCQRFWIMHAQCPAICCKEARADLSKKYIFKRYPEIGTACTPDSINWQNLGYGNTYRTLMTIVNWCIAIALIVLSLIFIILLKQKTIELKKAYNIDIVCPSQANTTEFKQHAWQDQQLEDNERLGLMHCYCFHQMATSYGPNVRNIKFDEFEKDIEGVKTVDEEYYCYDWLYNYTAQQSSVVFTSLVVVAINIIASLILTTSVVIEKNHTVNDETMGQFMKLTILQFINIGVIILIINFDFTETNPDGTKELFLGFLPIFNGNFKDFNAQWYGKVGKTLTLTLLLNIFTPHISKLTLPFLKVYKRCRDRGCSCKIWKPKLSEQDIDVNTKLVMQSDVNLLYTGDQIASHYVYAQNFTYLCVVLMYSSGLPILYPFAALFFMVLYWVYKTLLLKYYARTTKFNEEIPIQAMSWVKFGIFIHLLIGSLMFSNQDFFPKTDDKTLVGKDDYQDQLDVQGEVNKADVPYTEFFVAAYFERLEAGSQSTIYLSFIVIIVAFTLVFTLLNVLLNFFSCLRRPIYRLFRLCNCCQKAQTEVKSKDIYKEFDVLSMESMYTKAKEDLSDFNTCMENKKGKSGDDINFRDNRYPDEIDVDQSKIVALYERRMRQVELAVDDHLVHLHGKSELDKFQHLDTPAKLRYLLDKQQLIDKEKRMRLVDITQSFSIYDSTAFKATKSVQEKIETNPQYNLSSRV